MMAAAFDARTLAAIEAVQAGLELISARHGASEVREKPPGDLVTGTDLPIQARVESLVKQRFPNIAVVGEEGQVDLPSDEACWLVDPLCGTSNYAAGLPLCAVNVGLVDRGKVRLAAVGDGSTGHIYVSEAGGGAWRVSDVAEEPLHVGATSRVTSIDPHGGKPGRLRTFGREFAPRAEVMIDSNWGVRAFGASLVLAMSPPDGRLPQSRPRTGYPFISAPGSCWRKKRERSSPTNRVKGGAFIMLSMWQHRAPHCTPSVGARSGSLVGLGLVAAHWMNRA